MEHCDAPGFFLSGTLVCSEASIYILTETTDADSTSPTAVLSLDYARWRPMEPARSGPGMFTSPGATTTWTTVWGAINDTYSGVRDTYSVHACPPKRHATYRTRARYVPRGLRAASALVTRPNCHRSADCPIVASSSKLGLRHR